MINSRFVVIQKLGAWVHHSVSSFLSGANVLFGLINIGPGLAASKILMALIFLGLMASTISPAVNTVTLADQARLMATGIAFFLLIPVLLLAETVISESARRLKQRAR